jgi:hypothetical protein
MSRRIHPTQYERDMADRIEILNPNQKANTQMAVKQLSITATARLQKMKERSRREVARLFYGLQSEKRIVPLVCCSSSFD